MQRIRVIDRHYPPKMASSNRELATLNDIEMREVRSDEYSPEQNNAK